MDCKIAVFTSLFYEANFTFEVFTPYYEIMVYVITHLVLLASSLMSAVSNFPELFNSPSVPTIEQRVEPRVSKEFNLHDNTLVCYYVPHNISL